MPSTDRRLELKAKDIDGSDRLTAGCVLIDLASLGVSQTSVCAKGLTKLNLQAEDAPMTLCQVAISGFFFLHTFTKISIYVRYDLKCSTKN